MKTIVRPIGQLLIAMFLIVTAPVIGNAQSTSGSSGAGSQAMVTSDTAFISKNIMDNTMEIQLAQLGTQRTTDPRIKNMAQQMVADHTQILNDLKRVARQKNMTETAWNQSGAAMGNMGSGTGTTGMSGGAGTSGTGTLGGGTSTSGAGMSSAAGTSGTGSTSDSTAGAGMSSGAGTTGTSGTGTSGGATGAATSGAGMSSGTGTSGTAATSGSGTSTSGAGMTGGTGTSGTGTTAGATGAGMSSGSGAGSDMAGMQGMSGMTDISALQNATGTQFNTLFVSQMLTMHDAKVAELQSAIRTISDPLLKSAVTSALPKIRMHRDMLARINRSTSGSTSGSGGGSQQ